MAIWRRGKPDALLHHSDQASQYTSDQFQRLMADNGVICSMSFTVLQVTSGQFRAAARFADQPTFGLRAGDALHLAIASKHGATAYRLDWRFADAGPALGVSAQSQA